MRLPFSGSYPINQKFGVNPGTYAQFGLKGHNGIDYGLPSATTVVAAHSGKIFNGYDAGGYGNYIFVSGSGYESVYGHLQKFLVPSGAYVNEGQTIAYSDNTGFSTGAHLHFGVRPLPYNQNNGYGGYIDPQPILTEGGSNMYEGKTAEQWYIIANYWHAEQVALLKSAQAIADAVGVAHDATHVDQKAVLAAVNTLKAGAKALAPGPYFVTIK